MTFTCNGCSIIFDDSELQRLHMKTDYHRYNLKRKVLQIPPVTLKEFEGKQLAALPKPEIASTGERRRNIDDQSFKVRLMKCVSEEEIGVLIESLKVTTTVNLNECIFCNHVSNNVNSSISHMNDKHCFVLYDIEHLQVNEFLSEQLVKVTAFNSCLYCEKVFYSVESCKAHMVVSRINKVSKSHCKLDDEEDLSEFYEFEDWVDDDGGQSVCSDMEIVEEIKSEVKEAYVTDDETQLVLPSGVMIGSRLFKKYWRQNIKADIIVPGSSRDVNMILDGSSRAMTFMGVSGQKAIAKRANYKVTTRDVKKRMIRDQDFKARVGMKHNGLQHHYREQNPF